MKKVKLAIIVVLIIVLGYAAISYSTTLKGDSSVFSGYIKNKYHLNKVSIVKTVENQNEVFILYRDENSKVGMVSFEPNRFWKSSYIYSGSAKSSFFFDSYNFSDSKGTLIVLFGDNSKIKADNVSFTNGDITYTEQISNKDYVLSVYKLEKGNSISAENISLYDKDGNRINVR